MNDRLDFDPEKPLAPEIRLLKNARVIPYAGGQAPMGLENHFGGVFSADGNYIPEARTWRSEGFPSMQPCASEDDPNAVELKGEWVFGGLLYNHFGHFIMESLGRIWALDHLPSTNYLFIHKKKHKWQRNANAAAKTLFEGFGLGHIARFVPVGNLCVEKLHVPQQGFGLGEMVKGAPEMRQFFAQHFGGNKAANTPEKIYISRRTLYSRRDAILNEMAVEAYLANEGFAIMSPQDMPLDAQIAWYQNARLAIAADGSALHLLGLVGRRDLKLIMINRKEIPFSESFTNQFRAFLGVEPILLNTVRRVFQADHAALTNRYAFWDLETLGAELQALGVVSKGKAWRNLSREEENALGQKRQAQIEIPLREIGFTPLPIRQIVPESWR